MKQIFFLLALALSANVAKATDSPSASTAFKAVIAQQMEDMAQDDATSAYEKITPNVQKHFQSPDLFMNMVRAGYAPVYRHKLVSFGDAGFDENGKAYQTVEILSAEGVRYTAVYFMEHEEDESWKISGVVMAKAPETDA